MDREFKIGDLVHTFYLYDSVNAHGRIVKDFRDTENYKLQLEGTPLERYERGDPYNGGEFVINGPHMIVESERFGIVEVDGVYPGYVDGYRRLRTERDELGLENFLRKYGC